MRSLPTSTSKRGKYRPSKSEQGIFTTRLKGLAPIQLTPEQEAEARRSARLWFTPEARVWGIQKRNLNRNESKGIARAK